MIWGFIGLLVILGFGHFWGYWRGYRDGVAWTNQQYEEAVERSIAARNSQMNGAGSISANPLRETSTRF